MSHPIRHSEESPADFGAEPRNGNQPVAHGVVLKPATLLGGLKQDVWDNQLRDRTRNLHAQYRQDSSSTELYSPPRAIAHLGDSSVCLDLERLHPHQRGPRSSCFTCEVYTLFRNATEQSKVRLQVSRRQLPCPRLLNIRVCLMLYTPLQKAARAAFRPSTSSDPAR
jgi:hypothetical protein